VVVSHGITAASTLVTSYSYLTTISHTGVLPPGILVREWSVLQSSLLFSVGYFATEVVSLEDPRCWLGLS